MGHAGFNTRVNNEEGYVSEHAARMVMTRCLYR
jgi:hypothetical protein